MLKKEKSYQNLSLIIFLIFNVYYWYRYIFKYNSEGTSPTYSNTPVYFQLGKYALAVGFIVVLLLLFLIYNTKLKFGGFEFVLFCGFILVAFKSVLMGSFDFLIKNFIFIIPAYVVTFIEDDEYKKRFFKIFKIVLLYHLIYSFLQIGLYVVKGRLPALGYEGGLVRFGGGWDDPNAFGLFLVIPISYLFIMLMKTGERPRVKFLYLVMFGICLVLEILTFSFAGYLALGVCAIAMFVKYFSRAKLWVILFVFLVLAMTVVLFYMDLVLEVLSQKGGSASQHLDALVFKVTHENYLIGLFFGGSSYNFSENIYNIIFMNYGVLYLIGYLLVRLYAIWIAYKVYLKTKKENWALISLIFIVSYTICNVGIPYAIVFPMNYIYWVFVFYVYAQYKRPNKNLAIY